MTDPRIGRRLEDLRGVRAALMDSRRRAAGLHARAEASIVDALHEIEVEIELLEDQVRAQEGVGL